MASFLNNVTDQIPELPLYHPDVSFFQTQLQRKSSEYESGFSQVKSAYDSILNAPLTDTDNIDARDEYLKQAQDKLKNLSSVDLSKSSNVDQANNVFAPFWQDQMMLKDASYTRFANQQMQTAFSLRDSSDPEKQSQYSDASVQDIQNGLDKLKTAGRNINNYNNLDQRRFTPSVNAPAYWNKQLKDQDFKVEWDEQKGMMMIHHTNGEPTLQSFHQFALANMSPQMADMYRMQGRVSKEQSIKQAKLMNPGISDDQALHMVAQDMATDYSNNYNQVISKLNSDKSINDQSVKDFEDYASKHGGMLNQAQKVQYDQLKDNSLQLQNHIDQKKSEYLDPNSQYSTERDNIVNGVTKNPDQYFYNLASTRAVNNWAISAAHNEKRKEDLNPIWAEQAKISYENAGLKIQQENSDISRAHLGIDQYDSKTKRLEAQIKANQAGFSFDASGSLIPLSDNPNPGFTPGNITGAGTTDVTKIGNALDVFNQRQAERYADSNEGILSINGMGRAIVGLDAGNSPIGALGKVSQEDVVNYFSAAKRQLAGDTTPLNKDEANSKQIIDKALQASTGIKITDAASLRDAVIQYGKQYIGGKFKTGGPPPSYEDQQSLYIYKQAIDERSQALFYDKRRSDLMKQELASSKDPELNKLLVNKPDGSKDFASGEDAGNTLTKSIGSNIIKVADRSGNVHTYSTNELGKAFLDNSLSVENPGSATPYGYSSSNDFVMKINGKEINIDGGTYDQLQRMRGILMNRYGDPANYDDIKKRIATTVIPNIGEFSSKTGALGVNTNYDIDDPKQKDKTGSSLGIKMVQEISNPANQAGGIYVGDGKSAPELSKDDDINHAINSLSGMGASDLKKYVSGITHTTIGPTGGQAIKITFSPKTDANKTDIGGVDLGKLANKTIVIPISPNASGPTLQSLPRNSGHYIYQSILAGKTMRSDPMFDAAGFKYIIQPNNTRNPTAVHVEIRRQVFDPNTKKYREVLKTRDLPFYGPKAKTPDEVVEEINGLFSPHIEENKNNQDISINNDKQANQLVPIN